MKAEDRRLMAALAASLRKDGWRVLETPTSFSLDVMPEAITATKQNLRPDLAVKLRLEGRH
jgi:hypothetical protein